MERAIHTLTSCKFDSSSGSFITVSNPIGSIFTLVRVDQVDELIQALREMQTEATVDVLGEFNYSGRTCRLVRQDNSYSCQRWDSRDEMWLEDGINSLYLAGIVKCARESDF
jgi:hypothetical protein